MSEEAVRDAVRIEDEVVYGYGVVGAHLHGRDRSFAARRLAAHHQRRDDLSAMATGLPPPAPAYALPFPVADAATARDLAVRLEDATAAAAWALVAAAAPDSRARRLAVTMLGDSATAAARWRRLSDRTDDPALPGQPAAAGTSQLSTTPTTSPSSSTTASGSTS